MLQLIKVLALMLVASVLIFLATNSYGQDKPIKLNTTGFSKIYLTGSVNRDMMDVPAKILTTANRNILLIINSGGGSVFVGEQILGAMRQAKLRGTRFTCVGGTISASMAFIIMSACDKRYLLPYSNLLFHPPRFNAMFVTITPITAAKLLAQLTAIESRLTRMQIDALGVEEGEFMYHYIEETWWEAGKLLEFAPNFATMVEDVSGINIRRLVGFPESGPTSANEITWEYSK